MHISGVFRRFDGWDGLCLGFVSHLLVGITDTGKTLSSWKMSSSRTLLDTPHIFSFRWKGDTNNAFHLQNTLCVVQIKQWGG